VQSAPQPPGLFTLFCFFSAIGLNFLAFCRLGQTISPTHPLLLQGSAVLLLLYVATLHQLAVWISSKRCVLMRRYFLGVVCCTQK
jgi:hypothetical protein